MVSQTLAHGGGASMWHQKALEYWLFIQYIGDMNSELTLSSPSPTQWIQQCAQKLHERWHTVSTEQLEDVALDIFMDDRLRHMAPAEAAAAWLSPVVVTSLND